MAEIERTKETTDTGLETEGGDSMTETERQAVNAYEEMICVDYPKVALLCSTHILGWHPLIAHKITEMRKTDTNSTIFRQLTEEVTSLICAEAMQHLETEDYIVETPICKTVGRRIAGKKLVAVPIMRAGMGMENAVKTLVPKSRTGHIGLYRDEETLEPQEYFCKLPDGVEEREIYLLDPMLATGGSADAAIKLLKQKGCKKITFLCIIAAPQGIDLLQKNHPDVELFVGCLDRGLNQNGYIVPGLGDAGDRVFGTK